MTDSAAVSVSGGIVLVGVPHISPLLDKAEMLLGHATGLLCTGAAFSCGCSRRNLKTSCVAVTVSPWSSSSRKHSKESCRTLFSKKRAVTIRFLARKETRLPCVLGPHSRPLLARSHAMSQPSSHGI